MALPQCIVEAVQFHSADSQQLTALSNRFQHVIDIGQHLTAISDALLSSERDGLRNYLVDLELDVSLELFSPSDRADSSWVVHSAWLTEYDASELRRALDDETLSVLNRPAPLMSIDENGLIDWLRTMGNSLLSTVTSFSSANNVRAALAYWLAIDTLLATVLLTILRARFQY